MNLMYEPSKSKTSIFTLNSQSNNNQESINHGSGMIKPLNKITWDSFSQIAKLSGDVDHEPSTPKSNRGGKHIVFNDDDYDERSDGCDDLD